MSELSECFPVAPSSNPSTSMIFTDTSNPASSMILWSSIPTSSIVLWSLRSLPTQAVLWFSVIPIACQPYHYSIFTFFTGLLPPSLSVFGVLPPHHITSCGLCSHRINDPFHCCDISLCMHALTVFLVSSPCATILWDFEVLMGPTWNRSLYPPSPIFYSKANWWNSANSFSCWWISLKFCRCFFLALTDCRFTPSVTLSSCRSLDRFVSATELSWLGFKNASVQLCSKFLAAKILLGLMSCIFLCC